MLPSFSKDSHALNLWSPTDHHTRFKTPCLIPLQPTSFTLLFGALGAEQLQEAVLSHWDP